jgi:hypothetical protein
MVLCTLLLAITYYASDTKEISFKDLFLQDNFLYKAIPFFILVAAVYPLLGFSKKEIYISNFKENEKEIINLFENANYVLTENSGSIIKFNAKRGITRLFRMYEDTVTIDYSNNPVIIEGLRKDVIRFSRGIEYLCQKEEK